jgi:hypothetical protein
VFPNPSALSVGINSDLSFGTRAVSLIYKGG